MFRPMPGQRPHEYSEGSGYALDTLDLQARIEKDIETAAQKLYAVSLADKSRPHEQVAVRIERG